MKKLLIGALAILASCGLAFAQPIPPARVGSIGQGDLVQIVPGGVPASQSQFAAASQMSTIVNYQFSVPLTGFSIQIANLVGSVIINPAGTLATGTFLFPLVASDGQNLCIMSTQTQTAVTMTPPSGITIGAVTVTALVASTPVCWQFVASASTWFRTK